MKKKKGKGKERHDKCLQCDLIPCVDFYRSTEKLEGGEIYVLEGMIKDRLHVPCEIGSLIYSLCKLSNSLTEAFSFPLFSQCVRDMKASAFLLMCGHYRSSMQILRPVIENMLAGIYFDAKYVLAKNETEKAEIEKAFNQFWDGKYRIPIEEWAELFPGEKRRKRLLDSDFLLTWMVKKGIVPNKSKDHLNELIGLLNKYLHAYFPFTEVPKPSCPRCPASVKYDAEEYRKCVELFQDVTTILLKTVYSSVKSYFPQKLDSEEVGEALGVIKSLGDVEKEIKMTIIFSKELRDFISTLPSSTN